MEHCLSGPGEGILPLPGLGDSTSFAVMGNLIFFVCFTGVFSNSRGSVLYICNVKLGSVLFQYGCSQTGQSKKRVCNKHQVPSFIFFFVLPTTLGGYEESFLQSD